MIAPCSLDTQIAAAGFENRVLCLAKTLTSSGAKLILLHSGSRQDDGDLRLVGCRSLLNKANGQNMLAEAADKYLSWANFSLVRIIRDFHREDAPDVIQVESPFPFVPSYLSKRVSSRALIALDAHNTELLSVFSKLNKSSPFVSLSTAMTMPFVFAAESLAARKSDIILAVSGRDVESLRGLYGIGQDKLWIVPNGVDISMFKEPQSASKQFLHGTGERVVFFHGALGWYPNLEAANVIVDTIASRVPQAKFVICGRHPPGSLLRKVSKSGNTEYAGYVQNLVEYIHESDVCIAPILRGGGTKLKLLEYAAAGKPIVATFKAAEGLPFVDKVHALLFRHVGAEFIEAIRRILSNDQLADMLGSNAKKLAAKFDWSVIGSKLYDKYTSLLERQKSKMS